MEKDSIVVPEVPYESRINIPAEENSAHLYQGSNAEGPPMSDLEIADAEGPPTSPRSGSNTINRPAHLYLRPPYGIIEKGEYLRIARPLYVYARNGDWEKAMPIFLEHPHAVRAYITQGLETPLHIAAISNQHVFVTELLELLNKEDLEIRNKKGNTALCLAAVRGNVKTANVLIGKYLQVGQICGMGIYIEPVLIRGHNGNLPVIMAAKLGNKEMVEMLLPRSRSSSYWTKREAVELMKNLIGSDLYDIAGKMDLKLAVSDEEILQLLATKPMTERSKNGILETVFYWRTKKADSPQIQALQLIKDILKCAFKEDDFNIDKIAEIAPKLLFEAAKRGNFHLFKWLIYYYPEIVWNTNTRGLSMFHVAVQYRHESIFALLNSMDEVRKLITTYEEKGTRNNMLHLAATIAPTDKRNTINGAAFLMQQAICWYKAVEKIVPAAYRDMKNEKGSTPADIFDEEHGSLIEAGEKWMKATAKSCMLVAALTATVMFSSAFTVPGGNDNEGHPYLIKRAYFEFLTVSEVIGMLSSSTSILMFLSILTSRVDKYAFQRSLPCILIIGLTALFVSIASMVIAFCTTIYLSYGNTWVPELLVLLACVPIMFLILKFHLLFDIIHSTFVSRFLFQSSNLANH